MNFKSLRDWRARPFGFDLGLGYRSRRVFSLSALQERLHCNILIFAAMIGSTTVGWPSSRSARLLVTRRIGLAWLACYRALVLS